MHRYSVCIKYFDVEFGKCEFQFAIYLNFFKEKMAANQTYLTLAFWHVYFTTISEWSVN